MYICIYIGINIEIDRFVVVKNYEKTLSRKCLFVDIF